MKLVFLHGLGQSAEGWKEVRNQTKDRLTKTLELLK